MTYSEAKDAFESTPQFSATATLTRISQLLDLLHHPEEGLKIVHVAGTNGKGSTSTMTARILEEHGYKTGLFLSPYVVTFRERVSVNGLPIPEDVFAQLAERVLDAAKMLSDRPNFFELMTALALLYFRDENCSFAVLEVGVGGRLDATNAISSPLVSVITPISLDHTKILGETIEEIAAEKCGIIKPGCVAVSSSSQPADAMAVIQDTCKTLGVSLLIPDHAEEVACSLSSTCFTYRSHPYELQLLGRHQADNACTALAVCAALKQQGIMLSENTCRAGLRKAFLPARLEPLSHDPICILDGGHNPAGIAALFDFIRENRTSGRLITVFGCLRDKGFAEMSRTVAQESDILITTRCPSPRSCSLEDLSPHIAACRECYDLSENLAALEQAYTLAQKEDMIVICGSLYLAGSIKQIRHFDTLFSK